MSNEPADTPPTPADKRRFTRGAWLTLVCIAALLVLPVVIISAQEAIRAVPASLL
jgi:ABC-type phosphate transport system permease subunit